MERKHPYFVYLILLFFTSEFANAACKVVTVTDTEFHPALMTGWYKTDQMLNNMPVYSQKNSNRVRWMWWKDHGAFSRWYMGTDLGSKSVEAYRDGPAGSTEMFPEKPNKWFVVNDNKWVEDRKLNIACKEWENNERSQTPPETAKKETIRINGSKVNIVNGIYTKEGDSDGRPFYKSPTNLFLFWKPYKGYSRWYIGREASNDKNVLVFVDSDAKTPIQVPSHLNWMELINNNWTPTPGLKSSKAETTEEGKVSEVKIDPMGVTTQRRHTPHRTGRGCSIAIAGASDEAVDKLFYIQDKNHNGKPYYKSADNSFIYFVSFRGGHISRWHMSYPNGKLDDRVKAYVNSKVDRLEQLKKEETWLVYDTKQNMWQQKPDLRIYCSDCKVKIANSLEPSIDGEYGITPNVQEGKPVWVKLPEQNRFLYFNAHKNYGRWMLSMVNGEIGGVVHGYVNSWGETPDTIDKYERWEEKARGHRFRQSRLSITGNCGAKTEPVPQNGGSIQADQDDPFQNSGPNLKEKCPGNIKVKTEPKQKYAFVTWTDSDPSGDWNAHYGSGGVTPGSKFNLGETAVSFELSDRKNNRHRCEFRVTVVDEEPPNIFCPGDMHRTTRMNGDFQIVTWKDPYPYDNSLLAVNLEQTKGPKSGSQLKVGTHIIEYTASDHANNKKSCTFRVFVRDREAPRIHNCPRDFTIKVYESSNWAASPRWQPPTAMDNVDKAVGVNRVAGIDPGTKISVGADKDVNDVSIIYQATDSASNRAECKFTIHLVKDKSIKTHKQYEGDVPVMSEDIGGNVQRDPMEESFDENTAVGVGGGGPGRPADLGRAHEEDPRRHMTDNADNFREQVRDARGRKSGTWKIVIIIFVIVAIVCVIAVVLVLVLNDEPNEVVSEYRMKKNKGGWCSCCCGPSSKSQRKQGKVV